MKKLLLIAIIAALHISAARANVLPQIKETENGTKISLYIPGILIKTGSLFIDKNEDPEMKYLLKKMKGVKILVREGAFYKNSYDKKFARIERRMDRKNFSRILSVRSEEADVAISVREKKDKIKEVVILVDEEETFVCVKMKGNYDLKKLSKYFNEIKNAEDLNLNIASSN